MAAPPPIVGINSRRLYWHLAPIAAHVGVSKETFLADCEAGRVRVRVERFGDRQSPYVHSGDTLEYLASIGKGLRA